MEEVHGAEGGIADRRGNSQNNRSNGTVLTVHICLHTESFQHTHRVEETHQDTLDEVVSILQEELSGRHQKVI